MRRFRNIQCPECDSHSLSKAWTLYECCDCGVEFRYTKKDGYEFRRPALTPKTEAQPTNTKDTGGE